jgi:hypothetical protein
MQTLNQVIKQFREIAKNHKQINTFGFGLFPELGKSEAIEYPLMWTVQKPSSINGNDLTLFYEFIFADLVHKDLSNKDEVLSDQQLTALDVLAQLQHPSYEWECSQSASFETFEGRWDDEVTGIVMSISVVISNPYNRCAIPFEPTPTPIVGSGVVTIFDSDGNIIDYVSNNGSYTVNVGLTCETLQDCTFIISLQEQINGIVNPTSNVIPINVDGSFVDSVLSQDESGSLILSGQSNIQSPNAFNNQGSAIFIADDFLGIQNQKNSESSNIDITKNKIILNSDNVSLYKETASKVLYLDADKYIKSTNVSNTQIESAVTDSHTHSNKSTLDLITEAFTNALKTAYDSAVSWISTNGSNLINHLSNTNNPHSTTATQVDALKRDGSNANSDIDIDTYSFSAKSLHVKGTGGAGHIGLKHQSANATANSNEISLFAKVAGLFFKNDGGAVEQIESQANKGIANGYASLDAGGKVPLSNLPSTLLVYKGVWNATTNTPTLTNNDSSKAGHVYNVGTAGTQFSINWSLGDWLLFNDSGVIEKSDNSDDVVSVNGYQGTVVLNATDVGAPSGSGTSTGTNTGDNATNSQYSGLASSKQDTLTETNFGTFVNSLTAKTTPVDADFTNINDSVDSNKSKKLTWANLKATLKTYFDTLYPSTSDSRLSDSRTQKLAGKQLTSSGSLTGTGGNLYLLGNVLSVSVGDVIEVYSRVGWSSSAVSKTFRFHINTSNNLSGANQIAVSGTQTTNSYITFKRRFVVESNTSIRSHVPATGALTDDDTITAGSNIPTSITVPNLTGTVYLIVSGNTATSDTVAADYLICKKMN